VHVSEVRRHFLRHGSSRRCIAVGKILEAASLLKSKTLGCAVLKPVDSGTLLALSLCRRYARSDLSWYHLRD